MMRTQTLELDIPKVESQLWEPGAGANFSLLTAWDSWPLNEQNNTS